MRFVLASANPGKLRELGMLLAPLGHELVALAALGIAPPPETGASFEENALLKARHAARRSRLPALADDSGLEVDALDGRPGVHSARYAGERATDQENLQRMLTELQGVAGPQRTARYQCVIAMVRSPEDAQPLIARGSWEGRILEAPRGSAGFGYDPVFLPAGLERSAAQLTPEEKNALSHRAMAIRALIGELQCKR